MAEKIKLHSGQAVVEYLLLLAIIVGIIGGVVRVAAYRWYNTQINTLRAPLVSRLNQSSFGIPLAWFFAGKDLGEVGRDFDNADRAQAGLGPGANSNSNPNRQGGNEKDPSLGDGGGEGGNEGDGPNGPGRGGRPEQRNQNQRASNTRSGPTGTQGQSETQNLSPEEEARRKAKGTSSSDDSTSEIGPEADTNKDGVIDAAELEAARAAQDEEAGLTPEMRARRKAQNEARRGGGGGCADLSVFEILRIAIFVILAFIAFIIFFSSRGKGGKD